MPRLPARSLFLVLVPALMASSVAVAHDSWISRNGLKNAAGEWCCGEGDCFVIPPESVKVNGVGYVLFGVETVPYSEAMPSQPDHDGVMQFIRCKRPDGSRRCFFAPPPNT